MRRGFSIFLILFFGLGPLSNTLESSEDANLPPCCRRHGAHHCAMAMRMAAMMARIADPQPSFTVPLTCPLYPGLTTTILMPPHALTVSPARPHVAVMRALAPVFVRAVAQAAPSRAHAGRGPPAASLS